MTDSEFDQISVLFERKQFNVSQIKSLLNWVDKHEEDTFNWCSPADLIETLSFHYPDKQSGI